MLFPPPNIFFLRSHTEFNYFTLVRAGNHEPSAAREASSTNSSSIDKPGTSWEARVLMVVVCDVGGAVRDGTPPQPTTKRRALPYHHICK